MSIASFFNSPHPDYVCENLGAATSIAINESDNFLIYPVIKEADNTTMRTMLIEPGTYNLTMFGQLDTGDYPGETVTMASYSLKLIDMNNPQNTGGAGILVALATSSSHNINGIVTGAAWFISHFQRLVLPVKADKKPYKLTMVMGTVWNNKVFNVSNGPAAESSVGMSAKPYFALQQTF